MEIAEWRAQEDERRRQAELQARAERKQRELALQPLRQAYEEKRREVVTRARKNKPDLGLAIAAAPFRKNTPGSMVCLGIGPRRRHSLLLPARVGAAERPDSIRLLKPTRYGRAKLRLPRSNDKPLAARGPSMRLAFDIPDAMRIEMALTHSPLRRELMAMSDAPTAPGQEMPRQRRAMGHHSGRERRRYERITVLWQASLHLPERTLDCVIVNISASGCHGAALRKGGL